MIAKTLDVPALGGGLLARLAVAAPAFLLGLGLVFIVGFAHPTFLHDAAHDSRHGFAFPCH